MKRLLLLLSVLLAAPLAARVSLPAVISDGMVLQRRSTVRIWGNTDSDSKLSVTTSWDGKYYSCTPASNGNWSISVATPEAGGPYSITIDDGDKLQIKDILIGEVWICSGQSNMVMTFKGYPTQPVENAADFIMDSPDYDVHAFTLSRAASDSPLSACVGQWVRCNVETLPEVSAVAYLFARRIQHTLGVPVGIIVSAWGGTSILGWTPEAVVDRSISSEEKETILKFCSQPKDRPGVLFNGMIAPIAGYGAKGFLWYQGEANVNTPASYGKVLKAMIACWRDAWGDRKRAMPFYAVEIAPYRYGRNNDLKFDRPLTVEATIKALSAAGNAALIPTGDVGDAVVIHPARKREVGERLAMCALRNQYGYRTLECNPPSVRRIDYKGGKAYVYTSENEMVAGNAVIAGFEIAGKDECYYPAKGLCDRKNGFIELSSPDVPEPVAVRYGFHNYIPQTFVNWMGIPALPFRSENWDYTNQE